VYARGGQCTGTLTGSYSARTHTYRARNLDVSLWTVSTHLRRVFTKLEVGSRAAMAARLSALGQFDEGRASPQQRR
jgi:Bacterial regulatory proteins, luxR family